MPSMFDIPVWMNSDGSSLEYGLIAEPTRSTFCFDTIFGPLSLGFPSPSNTLPSISSDTANVAVEPVNLVVVPEVVSPSVGPKTCTIARPCLVSRPVPDAFHH